MKVRYPELDFSQLRAHWTPNPEFAQIVNAFSTVPAHIEPFLVKVMRQAQKALDPKETKLLNDIEIFNKQEMQHCKQHLALNKKLYTLGYPEMPEEERPYKEDYERFLATKSLRFNVAYCEGFEALGSTAAQMFFEDFDDLFVGADSEARDLWFWHLAEEFEHRSVCLDVYQTLYGKGFFAYLYRVAIFFYAATHIGKHTLKIARYLVAKDRENMTEDERRASVKREKNIMGRYFKSSMKRLVAVLSPWYDPGQKVASPGMREILERLPDSRAA